MADHDDDYEELDGGIVRPFMLTGGRTRSSGVAVAMESLVDRRAVTAEQYELLPPEQRQIFDELSERSSAAELSARLALPLGVVIVLVGDMAGLEMVQVHQTVSTGNAQLVRRLIDGVRAL